jgi:hypothetical protein
MGRSLATSKANDVSHVSMADEEIESVAGLTTDFAIRPSIDIMNNSHEHMHVSMAMITYLTNRIYVSMACNDSQRRRSQMSMARERVEPARSFAVQNIIHEVDRHHDDQPWTHACVHGRIDRSRRSDPCVHGCNHRYHEIASMCPWLARESNVIAMARQDCLETIKLLVQFPRDECPVSAVSRTQGPELSVAIVEGPRPVPR